MRHIILVFILISLKTLSQHNLQNGDLIFIESQSGQGKAIQLATNSKWTHIGIIFIESGKTYVYHAVNPVSKNTLEEFISLSKNGIFKIKRLDSNLVKLNIKQNTVMLKEANKHLNKPYDYAFNWSDNELYCSEYVWKLYKYAYNIELGNLKKLKDYDLSSQLVKETLTKRYGKNIPLNEKMISPGEIFDCSQLKLIN